MIIGWDTEGSGLFLLLFLTVHLTLDTEYQHLVATLSLFVSSAATTPSTSPHLGVTSPVRRVFTPPDPLSHKHNHCSLTVNYRNYLQVFNLMLFGQFRQFMTFSWTARRMRSICFFNIVRYVLIFLREKFRELDGNKSDMFRGLTCECVCKKNLDPAISHIE